MDNLVSNVGEERDSFEYEYMKIKESSIYAVMFPVLTALLIFGAVELGADPVLAWILCPLVPAYPFIWFAQYVRQDV